MSDIVKEAILISGMHRSGTSSMSGVMNLIGVDLGQDLLPASEFNPKGYFENTKINDINDKILYVFGNFWDSTLLLPTGWEKSKELIPIKNEIANLIETEFISKHFIGIKDPRLCLLTPFWQPLLESLGYNVNHIIVLRHPQEVFQSLAKRSEFSMNKCISIWMNHMLSLEKNTRNLNRVFVQYNSLLESPFEVIEKISLDLKIKFPSYSENIKYEIISFLDTNLKHYQFRELENKNTEPTFVIELFLFLNELTKDPENPEIFEKISKLNIEYTSTSRMFLG